MERIMNQIWGFACIILLPRIETEHTNVTVHNPRKINIVSLVINKNCESTSMTLDKTVEGTSVMFNWTEYNT